MKSMLKQNMISVNDSAERLGGGTEMEEWPVIPAVIISGVGKEPPPCSWELVECFPQPKAN